MKAGQQIDNYGPHRTLFRRGAIEKSAKREVKRARRRLEKLDPENAPKRHPYKGWTT